ncbi:MAG: RNA methyltransferase [Spirochaetales bacterium]
MDPTFDLSWFTSLKDRDLQREGILIAEGRLVAERVARRCEVLGILCVPKARRVAETLAQGRCSIVEKPKAEITKLAGYSFHRGLLLAAKRPSLLSFAEATARDAYKRFRRLLVLPAIRDPANLGVIVRTAAALGWEAVLLGPDCCDPFSRRVLRYSMSAVLSLPLWTYQSGEELNQLLLRGWELWAASLEKDAYTPEHLRSVPRLALVLGNEYTGLLPEIRSFCTGVVTIPQGRTAEKGVDSLNVAAAASILLWEGIGV